MPFSKEEWGAGQVARSHLTGNFGHGSSTLPFVLKRRASRTSLTTDITATQKVIWELELSFSDGANRCHAQYKVWLAAAAPNLHGLTAELQVRVPCQCQNLWTQMHQSIT